MLFDYANSLSNDFNSYLFSKNILVNQDISENSFFARVTLASFGIRITKGQELAHEKLIPFVASMIGKNVPVPFYRNFPTSVRELTTDQLLFDQLFHYYNTYGCGNFSEDSHSVFEDDFERLPFKEKTDPKNFIIVSEVEAIELLKEYVENMLQSTRPLNEFQYAVVFGLINDFKYQIQSCACKDTAIRILIDTRDFYYARFLALSDVLKIVDKINFYEYHNENIKKLNLKNQDRKFITQIIHQIFDNGYCNIRDCFERKAVWCGLLHHIHFQAHSHEEKKFADLMRGKGNQSVYSAFEKAMLSRDIEKAVCCLREGKGSGALLRNLNYILSRCKDEKDVEFVVNKLESKNCIILIQLLMQYANYKADDSRSFMFTRYNKLKVHTETSEEKNKRGTVLSSDTVDKVEKIIRENLKSNLKNRVGKVYISPEMYNIAVPIQENTSNGGYGVLPSGSRLHIDNAKKIRAFTYWEKVNDIDLSVVGIKENGDFTEFSWRTMSFKQSNEITFSGDQTSGFNGGSEFFDIDIQAFKKAHPDIKYLVFSNNVFSGTPFNKCFCKAGYMIRDIEDSGEIFEPQTVKSSFIINCESTFAYLFGIDLENNDFVWLNMSRNSNLQVAGTSYFDFLIPYFNTTSVLNIGTLYEMMATEIVSNPADADIIVSDEDLKIEKEVEFVRSYDFEKISAMLNAD